ncbi:MAG TPA: LiaF domain-containing protein [Bacteroidales bacterium]|nr:LiaF domain-containing protein [Bacteroidales bacterium]
MSSANKRRVLLGLLFIALGALLFNNFFDILPIEFPWYVFSWKMALIVVGVILLIGDKHRSTGIVFIAIGTFFLVKDAFNLDFFEMLQIIIPSLLILAGIKLLLPKRYKFWKKYSDETLSFDNSNRLEDVSVFGGGKKNITSENFQGGEVVCIFGGVELNFKNTTLSSGPVVVEVVCLFGGCTLYVPEDWTVRTEAVSIFGGFSDMRTKFNPALVTNPDKVVVIKGVAIFGGGEIKSSW